MGKISQFSSLLGIDEKLTKLAIEEGSGGGGGDVSSVNGQIGDVVLTATDVGAIDKSKEATYDGYDAVITANTSNISQNSTDIATNTSNIATKIDQTTADTLYKPIGYEPDLSAYSTTVENDGKYDIIRKYGIAQSLITTGLPIIATGTTEDLTALLTAFDVNEIGAVKDGTAQTIKLANHVYDRQIYTIAVRITGTIGGASGTDREFKLQLRNADGISIIENKPAVKFEGTTLDKDTTSFNTFTVPDTDPFILNGFKLALENNSGQSITPTEILIRIYAI